MAPHYLDQIPLDFSNPAVRDLQVVLSNYFRSTEVIALVRAAGARPETGTSVMVGTTCYCRDKPSCGTCCSTSSTGRTRPWRPGCAS